MRRVKSCPDLHCSSMKKRITLRPSSSVSALVIPNHSSSSIWLEAFAYESTIPSPVVTLGQCHLRYGVTAEKLMQADKEIQENFVACSMTPDEPENRPQRLRLQQTFTDRIESDPEFMRRYDDWVRRLRERRRRLVQ